MLQGAAAFAFDQEGRVLLARHSETGMWSAVEGAIEPGERPSDAALREFWEETGSVVQIVRLLGVFGGPEFQFKYANGDLVAYTSIAFEVSLVQGVPTPDGTEVTRLEWFSVAEVPQLPMRADNRIVVECAIASRNAPGFQDPVWRPLGP